MANALAAVALLPAREHLPADAATGLALLLLLRAAAARLEGALAAAAGDRRAHREAGRAGPGVAKNGAGVGALVSALAAADLAAGVGRQVPIELGVAHLAAETHVLRIRFVGAPAPWALEALGGGVWVLPSRAFAPLLDAGQVEHSVAGAAAPHSVRAANIIDADATLIRLSSQL
jgi:hypothetical protein